MNGPPEKWEDPRGNPDGALSCKRLTVHRGAIESVTVQDRRARLQLEAQLLRAKAVTSNITAYHQTRHPREITKIVRHLERIRQLNHDMADILLAANVALDEAALLDDEPV
jgi:hypothetical protein